MAIIKYMFLNEFRKEYLNLSQSVSEFLGHKINYFFVYIISILISLFNAFLVCLVFTALSEYINYRYFFWGVLFYSFLLAFFQGNNFSRKILKPDINDVFLYSNLSDRVIHFVYLGKGLINFFIESLQVLFIAIYLMLYFRTSLILAIINILMLIIINIFLFISGVYIKKEIEDNILSNCIIEIKYVLRSFFLIIFVYGISIISVDMIIRIKNISNYSLETIKIIFIDSINHNFSSLLLFITKIESYLNNMFVNENKGLFLIAIISFVIFVWNYYLKQPFTYRNNHKNYPLSFKEKFFSKYIELLTIKIEKFSYLKKDFLLTEEIA
ncbi:hypothetical protein [Anaerobranca gottschalkii]|nr:hypothetical protein [Anaerobranca gottschalkii]